jgi:phosphatidate cytidylyltransferase
MPYSAGIPLWPALLCVPVLLLLLTVLSKKTGLQAALQALGGVFYIVLPVLLLVYMRDKSIVLPLALILMIWMNDTMAYLVGSFIGKTPFSPISPKKTWEGTAGGAILTIAGAAVWGYFTPYYHMADWMALALCAAVAGTAGDLLESKLKRMANVKDSGTLMPGHGGALDRFDSLLVATPFAFCYAYLFMDTLRLTIF